MPTVSTSIKLDADLKARVQRVAERQRRSPHWVMREAIDRYTTQDEEDAEVDRSCDEAWRHYKETGLHVTHEEVDAWLARLEAGEDCPPPELHT